MQPTSMQNRDINANFRYAAKKQNELVTVGIHPRLRICFQKRKLNYSSKILPDIVEECSCSNI
jgi:hypothetical protein